jgi:fatty acid desaturase
MSNSMMGSLFISGIFILLLSVMFLTGYMTVKNDARQMLIIQRKKDRLNKKYILKVWGIIQAILLLSKIGGNDKIHWILVILIPLLITSFLLIHYFFIFHSPKDDEIELSDDWTSIKKQMERDIKLKKLLK